MLHGLSAHQRFDVRHTRVWQWTLALEYLAIRAVLSYKDPCRCDFGGKMILHPYFDFKLMNYVFVLGIRLFWLNQKLGLVHFLPSQKFKFDFLHKFEINIQQIPSFPEMGLS